MRVRRHRVPLLWLRQSHVSKWNVDVGMFGATSPGELPCCTAEPRNSLRGRLAGVRLWRCLPTVRVGGSMQVGSVGASWWPVSRIAWSFLLAVLVSCGGRTTQTLAEYDDVGGAGNGVAASGGTSSVMTDGGAVHGGVGVGAVAGSGAPRGGMSPAGADKEEFNAACTLYVGESSRDACRDCPERKVCDSLWDRVSEPECRGSFECVERHCLGPGRSSDPCRCMASCLALGSDCAAAWQELFICGANVCARACPG